jgi:hypothetical protein
MSRSPAQRALPRGPAPLSWLPLAVLAFVPLLAAACGRPSGGAPGGPVILITLEALRADEVSGLGGAPELTPNLAAFIRQADWAGRAIAPSSLAAAAMATIFTGLSPWQHHVILEGDARLPDDLITLPKAFKALGYRTTAFAGGRWAAPDLGYERGFDAFETEGRNRDAAEHLASLEEGKELVWIHMPEPQAPWVRRDWLLPRLGADAAAAGRDLPAIVEPDELELYSEGARPLTPAVRRRMAAMYRLNVAWADEKIGRLFEALRASGEWDRALVAVTAGYGEELGEHGTIGHGGDLERESLEVPLIVKLPSWCNRRVVPPGRQRLALAAVWATLVAVAGGTPPPAMAAGLFQDAPSGVSSELYFGNGTNLFSLVEGDDQLLWESRFAPAEAGFARARREALAGTKPPSRQESLDVIAERLFDAFTATPPLHGMASPRLLLERWSASGASRRVEDPARTAALARHLAARWHEFVGAELTPAEEDREWIDQLPAGPSAVAAPPGRPAPVAEGGGSR